MFWLSVSIKCFSYPAELGTLPADMFGITLDEIPCPLGFLGTVFGVG